MPKRLGSNDPSIAGSPGSPAPAAESPASEQPGSNPTDLLRRDIAVLFGGALGALALTACAREGDAEAPDARRNATRAAAQALSGGTNVAWVGTVLGARPPAARTGDLASQTSAALGGAILVVAQGCVTPGDGGGGLFFWNTGSGVDNGGTIIVPNGSDGQSGFWQRIYDGNINVKWFGAVGDGTGDDAPAINLAIQFAETNASRTFDNFGNTVFMPAGVYSVNIPSSGTLAAIRITNNNVCLVGAGMPQTGGTAILVNPAAASVGAGILVEAWSTAQNPAASGTLASNSHLRNLTIYGQASVVAGGMAPQDIVVMHGEQVSMSDCWIYGAARFGVIIESGDPSTFLGVTGAPAGIDILCDFWRLNNVNVTQCGPQASRTTGVPTDGAGIYVHGSDCNGGLAIACTASSCNVGLADFSNISTWIACYVQNGYTNAVGYAATHNQSTWLGCGTEAWLSTSFAPGWSGLVAGGTLADIVGVGSAPTRVGSIGSSLFFGAILTDGATYTAQLPGALNSAIDIGRTFQYWLPTGPNLQSFYHVGDVVIPPRGALNGFCYQCTNSGLAGGQNPFPASDQVGNTVQDGSVTWTCLAPAAVASTSWGLRYYGNRPGDYDQVPFQQFGWRWTHYVDGLIDAATTEPQGGPFGWTDSGNPRGVGLPFIANPLMNTSARWSWRQAVDMFGVPLTLFVGANVIYAYGAYLHTTNNAPTDSAMQAVTSIGINFATTANGPPIWPNAQGRFSVSLELPSVSTLTSADLHVVGCALIPDSQTTGWNVAVKIVNTGPTDISGVTLVWHYETFVTNYETQGTFSP